MSPSKLNAFLILYHLVLTLMVGTARAMTKENIEMRKSEISSSKDDAGARIARIENGLSPSVAIKGQPPVTMKLTDRMRHYHVPGVSIAFFDHGHIVWERGYGLADALTGRPVTKETLFQAGSISKPIAAMGALKLVEQGELKLDENVNEALTSWKLPENEFTQERKVTLRRILSHTAGLTVHGYGGYAAGAPLPTIPQILDGEKPAKSDAVRVDTVPGTVQRYSGGGFVLMQLMMTDATGETFPQLMHDLVLGPIGMSHSSYEEPLPRPLWPEAAIPHDENGVPLKEGFHTYPEMAAGGLWTTPSDLALAAIEMQKEYAGTSREILSPSMAREMLTRQIGSRGLGFELEKTGSAPRFGHYGVSAGYVATLQAYRDTGQGIAIMTNGRQGESLIKEILRAVAREYNWPDFQPVEHALVKVDSTTLSSFIGAYLFPYPDGDDKLSIAMKNGHLYVNGSYSVGSTYHFTFHEPAELLPEAPHQFFTLATGDTTFRFEKIDKGTAVMCTISSGGNQRQAMKKP
jgi:CubicO group peptidase (beta-lactamase class C family)